MGSKRSMKTLFEIGEKSRGREMVYRKGRGKTTIATRIQGPVIFHAKAFKFTCP